MFIHLAWLYSLAYILMTSSDLCDNSRIEGFIESAKRKYQSFEAFYTYQISQVYDNIPTLL